MRNDAPMMACEKFKKGDRVQDARSCPGHMPTTGTVTSFERHKPYVFVRVRFDGQRRVKTYHMDCLVAV